MHRENAVNDGKLANVLGKISEPALVVVLITIVISSLHLAEESGEDIVYCNLN